MSGSSTKLSHRDRVKLAMQRPEVQAKLHAPRRASTDPAFLTRLRALLADPHVAAEIRGYLFPYPPPDPAPPNSPAPTPESRPDSAPPVQPPGAAYWIFRRTADAPTLTWVDGTPGFLALNHDEALAALKTHPRPPQTTYYLVGPYLTRPSSVSYSSVWTELTVARKYRFRKVGASHAG